MRKTSVSKYSNKNKFLINFICILQAEKAKHLARNQIVLARKLQDPVLECKCWIYYAEGLIQLGNLKKAALIIERQKNIVVDMLKSDETVNIYIFFFVCLFVCLFVCFLLNDLVKHLSKIFYFLINVNSFRVCAKTLN
jgi:hypothetical protein